MRKINSIQLSHHLTVWVLVLFVANACSSMRTSSGGAKDGPPPVVDRASNTFPGDAVPRQEPLSKYGNPPSYVVFGKTYHTLKSSQGFVQRGIASWYGKKFHGRRTSSGEPYDMYGMTAAHTQLPLPTYVQVTNLKNGKQVVLRVNDRGPFHGNRIIDLSYTAATKLGIIKEGTGLVEVRALDPRNYRLTQNTDDSANIDSNIESDSAKVVEVLPKISQEAPQELLESQTVNTVSEATTISSLGPQVFVQVGAFGERENANLLMNQLNSLNLGEVSISSIVKNSKQLHRVRIGPLASVQLADDAVAQLNAMGMRDHSVVIE